MEHTTTSEPSPVRLPGGLELRAGRADDIEAIIALETATFGASDGPGVRGYLGGPAGPGAWAVVLDGERLVSTSARIPHRLALDGVEFPGGQIEYVATDPAYRRRGLVRSQFDWHHARSLEAGELAQFVGGIPYLYRRFGYGYGLDYAELFLFDPDTAPSEKGAAVTFRRAGPDDLSGLVAAEAGRPTDGLRVVRDAEAWGILGAIADGNEWETLVIAERDGSDAGWARLHARPEEGRLYLLPSMADGPGMVAAMIRLALDRAAPDGLLVIGYDHPGTPFGAGLRELGHAFHLEVGVYTRVPDLAALLDRLRPLLSRRLAESSFGDWSGALELSLYDSGVTLEIEHGEVEAVCRSAGFDDPLATGGVGIAPDHVGALVFGRWGARELAHRADDVLLGAHARLMEVLFPERPSDVVGDF